MRRRVARKTRRRARSNEPDRQDMRLKEAKLVPILRVGSQKSVPSYRPTRGSGRKDRLDDRVRRSEGTRFGWTATLPFAGV